MSKLNIFIPINKIDEERRLVYGQAAAEVLDNSGEMFDYEASKPYFEKWSENAFSTSGGKSHGNIRVMHTSKVAGIVSSPLGFNDEEKTIDCVAKVVDDAEWQMVLAGGYTGFSMGGRYVSRAKKSDGVTRYTADPVEISLVDKPCIPTATFSVIKADGLEETHRFRDDLYQKLDGENQMYVPTNDEMLPVARSLAKAAGRPEDAWVEFMDAARDDLVAKHDGQPVSEEAPVVEIPVQADEPVAKGENPFADDKKIDDKSKADDKGKVKAGEEEEEDTKGPPADVKDKIAAKDKEAEKADAPELQQGWQAKDGSFHLKKADAIAHNEQGAAPVAEPTLAERLTKMTEDAAKIAAGETVGPDEVEEPELPMATKADVLAVIEAPLAKFKTFSENELVKGMYGIKQFVGIVQSLECLHSSLAWESKYEGDSSALPGTLFEHLKGLGGALVAMATEEVSEMIARASKEGNSVPETIMAYDDGIMELSASTLGLEKSAFVADLTDRLEKRNPSLPADALAKVAAAEATATDALEKAAKAEGQLAELEPLVKTLQDQMNAILKTPRSKAPIAAFTAVSKSADHASTDEPGKATGGLDLSKMDPAQLADAAIRLSQQHGHHLVLPVGNGG